MSDERWKIKYDADGAASIVAPADLVETCGHGAYLGSSFGGRGLGTTLIETLVNEANDYKQRLANAVTSYEAKVQEFAAETLRASKLHAELEALRASGTVCVRLDGLTDKIAAALGDEWDKGTTTESEAAVIVSLLQSLAVQ